MIFSKKRLINIINSKHKTKTKKNLKKKKKYKKHNSFRRRRRKNNLRINSIKKKKRIAKKKRKAFIRKGGNKLTIYSNIQHINHLNKYIKFKKKKNNIENNNMNIFFGGASGTEEFKKYFILDFLKEPYTVTAKLYEDDTSVEKSSTVNATSENIKKQNTKKKQKQMSERKISQLPRSSCKPRLITVGNDISFWINPSSQDIECDSNTIQEFLNKKLQHIDKKSFTNDLVSFQALNII